MLFPVLLLLNLRTKFGPTIVAIIAGKYICKYVCLGKTEKRYIVSKHTTEITISFILLSNISMRKYIRPEDDAATSQ